MPQYFGHVENKTNVLKERNYKFHFLEIMQYEILIDMNKWKPGNSSKKLDQHFEMIEHVILNAIAMGQR